MFDFHLPENDQAYSSNSEVTSTARTCGVRQARAAAVCCVHQKILDVEGGVSLAPFGEKLALLVGLVDMNRRYFCTVIQRNVYHCAYCSTEVTDCWFMFAVQQIAKLKTPAKFVCRSVPPHRVNMCTDV